MLACLALVVFAGLVSLRLRYQPFRIPTGAMEKTLLIGDHLLADNWAYNIRLPLSSKTFIVRARPRRGDVITFRYPEDRTRVFVKRVIGLPGESVAVRGKAVYIDGTLLKEDRSYFGGAYGGDPVREAIDAPASLGEADDVDALGTGLGRQFGPVVVPADSYFVLGDNRDNSKDSRYWGYLNRADILGQVTVIYWSWDAKQNAVRFARLGRMVR
jgi:signal peptidase I